MKTEKASKGEENISVNMFSINNLIYKKTMKKTFLRTLVLVILMAVSASVSAQFNVTMSSDNDHAIKFVSAVNTDESTYFYVTKTAKRDEESFTCGKFSATVGYKKYKMKDCYNVSKYSEAEPAFVILDKAGQSHNFIMEFEKLPMNTTFDIVEEVDEGTPWTFSGVMIDTLSRVDFIDPNDFVGATPAKIIGRYASKGTVYSYYINDGIVLTAHFAKAKNYGKYYQVYLDIINNTDHSVAFDIANVEAQGVTIKKEVPTYFALETLTADEYDKKVRNRQAWNSFFNAFAEASAANNAGVTTVNTSTTTNSYGSSHTTGTYNGASASVGAAVGTGGAAVGVGVSAYSGRYNSDTYSSNTTTSNSSTVIHDGAIQYMARQQAAQNIAAYDNALAYDRANLWENYLKINTIKSGESYGGFFNIKYKKADSIVINIKIDGVVYRFFVNC